MYLKLGGKEEQKLLCLFKVAIAALLKAANFPESKLWQVIYGSFI